MNKKLYFFIISFFCFSFTILAQTVSISGVVTRHNGVPEEGVTVHCTNANSVVTGVDGIFSFTDLPAGEDYAISATKESDPNEFITVLDALKTKDIIIEWPSSVSEFQKLAGDVNSSGSVSTYDAVVILLIADKIQEITVSDYWNIFGADFTFFEGCVYQGTDAECIGMFLENVTEDVNGLEMIATKKGDVAIDADHLPPPVDAPEPVFYFEDQSVMENEVFEIEILVEDFIKIAGFQHTINWDPAILELDSVNNLLDFSMLANENFSDEGLLPVVGASASIFFEGVTLDDGSVLYAIKFKALSEISSLSGILDFSEDLIQKQVVYRPDSFDLFIVNSDYEAAVVTSTSEISNLKSFEIFPNPSENFVTINASFEDFEKVELNLFNSVGKPLKSWTFEGNIIEEQLNLRDLPKGIYVLKLISDDGFAAKKLIKL